MTARRYNKGKTRFGLIPDKPLFYLAEVYTKGAHKYSLYEKDGKIYSGKDIPLSEVGNYTLIESGADNWRNGLPWMEAIDSVERHIKAWKAGEEDDPELQTKHLANAAWGMMSLMEFYQTHPEMDDRPLNVMKPKKIGLDIDGVLGEFVGHAAKWAGVDRVPTHWNDPIIVDSYNSVRDNPEFWATMPVKTPYTDIPFEPHCYITARSIDPAVTQKWLDDNRFPRAPLICIPYGGNKVQYAKDAGVEIFVDDYYKNFVELTNGGIFTYLFDAPYNQHYNVGHRRIKSLKELAS